jgi:DNA-binding NarL/FixJ family response regulator
VPSHTDSEPGHESGQADGVPAAPIRVALAEDSFIVRQAIEQIIAAAADVDLIGSYPDADTLVEELDRLAPDVILTDIRMPPAASDEGIRLAARLRQSHPEIGVVVLSQYAEPHYVLQLLEAGCEGRAYLLKESVHNREELVSAIRAVAAGGSVIDPKVVEVLVQARTRAARSPLARLTPRELELLTAVAEGRSNAAMADTFVLSKRAVEKHITGIFLKLGLTHEGNRDEVSKRVMAVLMYLSDKDLLSGLLARGARPEGE